MKSIENIDIPQKKRLSDLAIRFMKVLEVKNYTGYKLSKEVPEITEAKITFIRTARNEPSKIIIDALLEKFPDVSNVWLLTGEGEMFKSKKDEIIALSKNDNSGKDDSSKDDSKLENDLTYLKSIIALKDELIDIYKGKINSFEKKIDDLESSLSDVNDLKSRLSDVELFIEAAKLKLIVGTKIEAAKQKIKNETGKLILRKSQ